MPVKKKKSTFKKSKPYKVEPKEVFADPVPDHGPDGRVHLEEEKLYSDKGKA